MFRLFRVQQISTIILGLSVISACGDTSPEQRSTQPFIKPIEFEPEEYAPADYRLADMSCQQSPAEEDLQVKSTWLYRWQLEDIEHSRYELTDLAMSGSSLTSPAIEKTTYNDLFTRYCDLADGVDKACLKEDGQEKGWGITEGFPLRYCAAEKKYGRDTYEGIGLHAAEFVTQAHHAYEQFGGDVELDKITLSVLPQFTTYYDNLHKIRPNAEGKPSVLKVVMTHNAMYLPALKMVAVLPEKAVERDQLKGFFWESPFVLAHEYGHHIEFQLRNQGYMPPISLTWNPMTHSYDDNDPVYLTASGKSSYALLTGAYSEAFADLLAYYGADGHSSSLVGLACFGLSRDVSRESFADGTAKIITTSRIDMLLSGNAPEGGCVPDFSDIHYHGAMLAHTVNRTFSELTAAAGLEPESEEDFRQRYRLALTWMQKASQDLEALMVDDTEAARLFEAAATGVAHAVDDWLTGFTLVEDETEGALRERICDLVAEQWPAVDPPPFSSSKGCQQD